MGSKVSGALAEASHCLEKSEALEARVASFALAIAKISFTLITTCLTSARDHRLAR